MPKSNPTDFEFLPAPVPQAPLDDRQRVACLRLIRTDGIGRVTFRELINRFGGAAAALDALPELARKSGRGRPFVIPSRSTAEDELAEAQRIGAQPIFTIEPHFPRLLVALDVPPPMIYAKGRLDLLDRDAIAIVGSRDASAAGRKFTRQLARAFADAGLVVVSGLARGIDGEAHLAALDGGTVAVLAGGIDHIYPPEHEALHRDIGDKGCLISDRPPGFRPTGKDFPRRNELISGLAHAVVVIEAARRSGSLVTARHAAEQGRQVFAVPGHPLDPRAEGTNHLLQDGAAIALSAADVLAALKPVRGTLREFREARATGEDRLSARPPPPRIPADDRRIGSAEAMPETSPPPDVADSERARVLAALGPMPIETDELVRVTGLSVRAIQVALMDLDLAGLIERHGQQLVSLR